jgi:hypothetical protein
MTRKRPLFQAGITSAVLTALLLVPSSATAQRATGTLIVRVENADVPVEGVEVTVLTRRTRRVVGTTGIGGLIAVDQLPLDITTGTRVSTEILECGAHASVLLVPDTERLVTLPSECVRKPVGSFFWGQTERIVIRLDGDRVDVERTRSEALDESFSGFRFQVAGLYTALWGEEFDQEKDGLGAEVKLFYTWPGGLGIGGGGSVTNHDVNGIDEDMWKWSAFLEPRYTFFLPRSRFRPHVLARVSYNWFAYEEGRRLGENGWGFGGGIGAAYPLGSWVAVDIGVYLGYLSVASTFEGQSFPRSGTELQLTAGLRFF